MLYLIALVFALNVVYGNFGARPAVRAGDYVTGNYGYGAGLPIIVEDGIDMVQTPHGLRPAKCVIRHESADVHLETTPHGTIATYRDRGNMKAFFPLDLDCVENAKELFPAWTEGKPKRPFAWDIDTGYTPSSNFGNFTSTYKLPNQTPSGGGLTYWFIGFQNNDGSGIGLTIAQPVVNSQSGWQTEPWNCCPSGQSNTGSAIQLTQGQSTQNYMYGSSSTTVIGSTVSGQNTKLSVATAGRNWDWACVTLETYASSCDSYPTEPFDFGALALSLESGSSVTPSWSQPGGGQCGGTAQINGATDVKITGSSQ